MIETENNRVAEESSDQDEYRHNKQCGSELGAGSGPVAEAAVLDVNFANGDLTVQGRPGR